MITVFGRLARQKSIRAQKTILIEAVTNGSKCEEKLSKAFFQISVEKNQRRASVTIKKCIGNVKRRSENSGL